MDSTIILIIGIILTIIVGIVYLLSTKNKKIKRKIYWEDDKSKLKNVYCLNKEKQKEGKEIFYYRSGKTNKERNWIEGKIEGLETIYYETGKLYIQKNYKNGLLEGEYVVFSLEGEIIEKYIYQNGNIISSEEYPIHHHYDRVSFYIEPLVEDEDLSDFYQIEYEYDTIRDEEDTKDEEKKVSGVWSGLKKIARVTTGYQAYQDRKSAKRIREVCDNLYDEALRVTDIFREKLENRVSDFGNKRLHSLQNTTGMFLKLLKDMGQNNNIKEYAVSKGIGFSIDSLEKMERIDMEVSKALTNTAIVGGLGTAAAMGTPALVTSAVGAFATASTGTAISTLSGAAATNATLAWLGGGSLAAGGGGMAAGAATLATIKVAATGGVALIASGLLASTYYSKKLTEVKEKQKAVEIEVNNIKVMWELLEGINKRTNELGVITSQLEKRIHSQLEFLYPLSVDFDSKDEYYSKVFQKNGALIISMNELAQTPLLDEEGNLSSESMNIVEETQKILNTNL